MCKVFLPTYVCDLRHRLRILDLCSIHHKEKRVHDYYPLLNLPVHWRRFAILFRWVRAKLLQCWSTRTADVCRIVHWVKGRPFERYCCSMWSQGNGEADILIIYWNCAWPSGYVWNRNCVRRRSKVRSMVMDVYPTYSISEQSQTLVQCCLYNNICVRLSRLLG